MENEILWERIAKLTTERDYFKSVLESIAELCDETRPTDEIILDVKATANV